MSNPACSEGANSGAPRLYYLDDIPTPYRLGVQRRVAERWGGAFRIAYCAEAEPGRSWSLDFDGLDVEFLPGRLWRPPLQRNPFSFKWNPTVLESLESFQPDVVVLSGYAHWTMRRAARWCRRNGIPYGMACETSCRSSHCDGWRWTLKRYLVGPLVRDMAFGLPVGRESAEYFRKLGARTAPMHFFPNTPDTTSIISEADRIREDASAATALCQRLGIPLDKKIVLFVGRLIDAKRPLDAVEAFLTLDPQLGSDAILVVVGDGPLREPIEARAREDARIICLGWLSDTRLLAQLMGMSACMLLPSAHEPWGAVVNEAMAAGIPVIASDRVCAAIELISQGTHGFIHPVGDIKSMERALASILEDEQRRFRMGCAAREQAEAHGEIFAAANLLEGVCGTLQNQSEIIGASTRWRR